MLLDYDADITITNSNNKTAGEEAFDRHFYEISEKICEVEQKLLGDIVQESCDDKVDEEEENINEEQS
jgi:hypothetical protein